MKTRSIIMKTSNFVNSLAVASFTALLLLMFISPSYAVDGQRIVVYGASGKIGGLVVNEALDRGHHVVGVSRSPERLSFNHPEFEAARGDVSDLENFTLLANGADAIVVSVQGAAEDNKPENTSHALAASTAISALGEMSSPPYIIQLGGAALIFESREEILSHAWTEMVEGTPQYANFFGHYAAREAYRFSDIDWSFIIPPVHILGWSLDGITDTQKRGEYRTSTTELIIGADGRNSLYAADLAAAIVDELENKAFMRQRFTVGY